MSDQTQHYFHQVEAHILMAALTSYEWSRRPVSASQVLAFQDYYCSARSVLHWLDHLAEQQILERVGKRTRFIPAKPVKEIKAMLRQQGRA